MFISINKMYGVLILIIKYFDHLVTKRRNENTGFCHSGFCGKTIVAIAHLTIYTYTYTYTYT